MGSHLTATGRHLPHGITVLPATVLPDTSERAPVCIGHDIICNGSHNNRFFFQSLNFAARKSKKNVDNKKPAGHTQLFVQITGGSPILSSLHLANSKRIVRAVEYCLIANGLSVGST